MTTELEVVKELRLCQTQSEEVESRRQKLWKAILPSVQTYLSGVRKGYDHLSLSSICDEHVTVERQIEGRWGGEDFSEYSDIPIGYFLSDEKANYVKEVVRLLELEKIEDERKVSELATNQQRKEYEKLKLQFEGSQSRVSS